MYPTRTRGPVWLMKTAWIKFADVRMVHVWVEGRIGYDEAQRSSDLPRYREKRRERSCSDFCVAANGTRKQCLF